jgi:hypothetical protein
MLTRKKQGTLYRDRKGSGAIGSRLAGKAKWGQNSNIGSSGGLFNQREFPRVLYLSALSLRLQSRGLRR